MSAQCYCRILPAKEILDIDHLNQVEECVIRTNEIIRETYQYIKAFCLYQLENSLSMPEIDRSFIKIAFSLICDRKRTGGVKPDEILFFQLESFYQEHYRSVQQERFMSVGKDILDAEIIQMITAIENHIKTHFYDYVRRLVSTHIPRLEEGFRSKRSKLMNDLYNHTYASSERFHLLIDTFGPLIVHAKNRLYSKPQTALPCLFFINRELQARKEKTFSFLPMRRTMIPCSISLSQTICSASFNNHEMWGRITDKVDLLYNVKPGFKFSSLRTDGISCSLCFVSRKKKAAEREEQYIDQLDPDKLEELQGHNLIAGDPNKGNLVMLRDNFGNTLRYSAIQRRRETKSNKYKALCLQRERNVWGICPQDEGAFNLRENLTLLKAFNSKTTHFEQFMEFVRQKNKFVQRFREHYLQAYYRKFKFNVKINTKRSQDQFLNRLEQMYGSPDSTTICMGDWEQRAGISFGKPPTLGVGIRNLFRKRGYQVYLVDEYRTSITCNKCKCENEYNFLSRKDPRPWKDKQQKIWGLSRCTNDQCRTIHNRDVNAACNIHEIASSHVFQQALPTCFVRTTNHTRISSGPKTVRMRIMTSDSVVSSKTTLSPEKNLI